MTDRVYETLLSFLITFALGVAVSSFVLRLWFRYVVGVCATDWSVAVILGLVVATATTVLELWAARGSTGRQGR